MGCTASSAANTTTSRESTLKLIVKDDKEVNNNDPAAVTATSKATITNGHRNSTNGTSNTNEFSTLNASTPTKDDKDLKDGVKNANGKEEKELTITTNTMSHGTSETSSPRSSVAAPAVATTPGTSSPSNKKANRNSLKVLTDLDTLSQHPQDSNNSPSSVAGNTATPMSKRSSFHSGHRGSERFESNDPGTHFSMKSESELSLREVRMSGMEQSGYDLLQSFDAGRLSMNSPLSKKTLSFSRRTSSLRSFQQKADNVSSTNETEKEKNDNARLIVENYVTSPEKNMAFIFVKPHAAKCNKVQDFVESYLKEKNISIVVSGSLTSREILDKDIIDKHYSAIASNAIKTLPKNLLIHPTKKADFEKTFALKWDALLKSGNIHNLTTLQEKYPNLTANEIDDAWSSPTTVRFKLGPGLSVGRMVSLEKDGQSIFVVNGFYASMRELYISNDARVKFYVIEWNQSDLSWAQFRKNVIGATDPKVAESDSIRAHFYKSYAQYDLEKQPDLSHNVIHGSASPIEAMKERATWLDIDISDDPYARLLLSKGVPLSLIQTWSENGVGNINGKEGHIFDLVEELDGSTVLQLALDSSKVA